MRKRLKYLSVGIAVVGIAVSVLSVAVYAFIGNPLDPFDNKRFSSAAWLALDPYSGGQRRARMARDLVNHHLPVGMSEAQVQSLLGPFGDPLSKKDAGSNPLPGDHAYEYLLGNWSMYGYDDAFLYVCFDSSGKLIHAEINGY